MSVNELDRVLAFGGLTVLLIGLFASVFERSFAAGPLAAMLAGWVLGPLTGVIDPATWPFREVLLEQVARFTLAFGLIEVAMRLPEGGLRKMGRSLFVLLGGVMPLSWAITALLGWWILGLPFWIAVLVGGILAPTDPVIASAIVNGDVARGRVPESLRQVLSAESGLNDGLALAFVAFPIVILTRGPGALPSDWLLRVVVWEVGAAVLMGALLGALAGRAWSWARSAESMDAPTVLMYGLALALVILGSAGLIGSDDILAVFVGGIVFDRAVSQDSASEKRVQKAVTRFFTTPVFVLFGASLPVAAWMGLGWKAVAFPVAVLLLRRLPPVLALAPTIPRLRGIRQRVFLGWFGPMGVASIYYAFLAMRRLGSDGIWEVSSLVIAASVALHGLTATWAAQHFPEGEG